MNQDELNVLIDELELSIQTLLKKNRQLQAENVELKSKLDAKEAESTDLFAHLETNDRIAMKAKVEHLLRKIDDQLSKQSAS